VLLLLMAATALTFCHLSLVEQGYGPPASDILETFEADRKKQGDKICASHSMHDVEKKSNTHSEVSVIVYKFS
jgi:hypothetical protein